MLKLDSLVLILRTNFQRTIKALLSLPLQASEIWLKTTPDLKLHDLVVHGKGVYCDVVGVGGNQGLHGGRHVRVHLKELSTEKNKCPHH